MFRKMVLQYPTDCTDAANTIVAKSEVEAIFAFNASK